MLEDIKKILDESIEQSKIMGMSSGETIDFLSEDETTKHLGYNEIEEYIYSHWNK